MRIPEHTPAFETRRGQVYEGDALEILRSMPDGSVNLVITSPPYALKVHPARFLVQLPEWFIKFLTDPGDTVLDIFGGSMTSGWAVERMGPA